MAAHAVENKSEMDVVETPPQDLSTSSSSKEQAISHLPDDTHESLSGLPPKDGGKAAWLFLAAAFVVEVLTIGECLVRLGVIVIS
jgi:hypothetical protein